MSFNCRNINLMHMATLCMGEAVISKHLHMYMYWSTQLYIVILRRLVVSSFSNSTATVSFNKELMFHCTDIICFGLDRVH